MIIRDILHYGMHYLLPFIIAFIFFKKEFWKASIILLAANIIDLDHLLATPFFDSERCSIGFHPLHSYIAIGIYLLLLIFPKSRLIGIGLIAHISIDFLDCLWI